jgi:hypothetical protein
MKNTISLILIIVIAYVIRILYPSLYMSGSDMPGHILASMRLHQTSLLITNPPYSNFFAQVMHFKHGYSTILIPWLLYELFFGFFNITVNEINLVYINSIIGLFSLISVYWFVKENFDSSIALLSTLLIAIFPVHVGLSRAHVGYLLFYLTFYFLNLTFLHKYIVQKKSIWLKGYFLSIAIYIGCDNAFPIGLFLQIAYLFLIIEPASLSQYIYELKRIYFSPYLLTIIIPIGAYIAFTILSIRMGIESGYLLRLFEKVTTVNYSFGFTNVFYWLISLIGLPAGVFVIAIIDCIKTMKFQNRRLIFLIFLFLIYLFLIMTNMHIEKNYVIFLCLPIAVTVSIFLIKRPIWMFATIVCTLIYTFAVVYRVDIGFPVISNYGSLDYKIGDNDCGIKTLGYLVRSDELKISRGETERDAIGLFLDYEGAQYYIGDNFHDRVAADIQQGQTENYQTYVMAYQNGNERENSRAIQELVETQGLTLIGKITKEGRVIILLYSNLKTQNLKIYPVEMYNKKFDQDYGNLDFLPKLWLGSF